MCEVCKEMIQRRDGARIQYLGEISQGHGFYLVFYYDTVGKVVLIGAYDSLEESEDMLAMEHAFGLHVVVCKNSVLPIASSERARAVFEQIEAEAAKIWDGKIKPDDGLLAYLKKEYCFQVVAARKGF